MKRVAVAIVVSLLSLSAGAQPIPPSPDQAQPSPSQQQNTRPTQSQSPSGQSQAVAPKPAEIVAPANDRRPSNQESNGERKYPEWLSKLFSDLKITDIVIALFTVGLAIYTARLWKSTEKLWAAGERQLGITARALEHSAETAERQLRAYVFATRADLANFGSDKPIVVHISYKNTGQTPAYRLSSWFGLSYDKRPRTLPFPKPDKDGHESDLGPGEGSHMLLNFYAPLSADQVKAVVVGRASIWADGGIVYTDAFGKKRTTSFRYVFGGHLGSTKDEPMAIDTEGNEAD